MMTLRQLAAEPPMLPTRARLYLTDRAEARGKQELFTRQSPQKLKESISEAPAGEMDWN